MAGKAFLLMLGEQDAPDELYRDIRRLEVVERADGAATFRLVLGLALGDDGSWPYVDDDALAPLARVAVSFGFPGAGGDALTPVIEGYVTDVALHAGEAVADATLEVRGMDAIVLMEMEEKVVAWPDMADSDIAQQIFAGYAVQTDVATTSPVRQEHDTLVVQRSADGPFLRMLARRNGFEMCLRTDASGTTCHWGPPALDGTPQRELALRFGDQSTLVSFDAHLNATRPLAVKAAGLDRTRTDASATATSTGRAALGARSLEDLVGGPLGALVPPLEASGQMLLAAHPTADTTELQAAAQAVRDEAAWLLSGSGQINADAYRTVLRAGRLVLVKGAGTAYSGRWYVTVVRHTVDADGSYRVSFDARRNARDVDGSEAFGASGALVSALAEAR